MPRLRRARVVNRAAR